MTAARIEDWGDRLIVWNLNAGRRGALTADYYPVLHEALAIAAAEPRIVAVILVSEGGFFSAGGDLNVLATRAAQTEAERRGNIEKLHDLIRAVHDCPKPVIAAIEGGAAGAGLSLALACDLSVAARDARFTAAYVKAGLVPDAGLTHALAAGLPRALANRMVLLGEPVGAERLHALGALSELAEPGTAFDAALELANRLASGPSATQGAIKALMTGAAGGDLHAQLDAERDAMAHAQGTPEAAEGIRAFLEKRAPDFAKLRETT
ncbi:oxepin-CoA hydrolase, alternative type [Limimaricola pyoseonensis]|uniref:Enoyl-CoA hydratase/carnithine racemase n=1 Tax=Limimaricola pyoseonensis TaxID=521013 RepID=A0A1G7JCF3_9RHOB|nr:enoyl-CoA hydratase family protein [Limimaricola pyoseonensis]SDF22647.1 Enoyl-CoA hydratase/carnithine racemase [Limimaricola pyoseonensis]